MTFENRTWFLSPTAPAEMPIRLTYLDSKFCWCDPIVEVDENGREVLLHRQITWS
jgi:hypothetical protein